MNYNKVLSAIIEANRLKTLIVTMKEAITEGTTVLEAAKHRLRGELKDYNTMITELEAKQSVTASEGEQEAGELLEQLKQEKADLIATHKLTVEEAYKIWDAITAAEKAYKEAEFTKAEVRELLTEAAEEFNKAISLIDKEIDGSITERIAKLRDNFHLWGGTDFETAMKLISNNLLDAEIPPELLKLFALEYGVELMPGAIFKDALVAVWGEKIIERNADE